MKNFYWPLAAVLIASIASRTLIAIYGGGGGGVGA